MTSRESSAHISEGWVSAMSLVLVAAGIGIAYLLFRNGTALVEQPAGPVVTAARNNLYGDAVNEAVFEKPGIYLTRALVFLDNRILDGAVNGLAALVGGGSGRHAAGADRLRPDLRLVDARRRAARHRGDVGGGVRMTMSSVAQPDPRQILRKAA